MDPLPASNPEFLRVSFRVYFSPAFRSDYLGFRCARDGSP
jgi:formylglycine-generating enzyme required for sulfatase activity